MAVTLQDARRYPRPTSLTHSLADLTNVQPLRVDGGTVWGTGAGRQLLRSTDEWVNRTLLHTFDETIQWLEPLANGEVIVSTGRGSSTNIRGELFVSSGFAANPTGAAWTKVLEASGDQNRFNQWGLHAWGRYVIAGEYGAKGDPDTAARRVWFSTDHGQTFSVIFDLRDVYPNPDPFNNAHMHCAHIDGYRQLLWVAHGDTTYRGIYYRPLAGGDWVQIEDNQQPTTITAVPSGVLFGQDGVPNGVLRWTPDGGLRTAHVINPDHDTALTHVAQRGARDPSTGAVWFCFGSALAGTDGVILVTNDEGRTVHEVLRVTVDKSGDGVQMVTIPTPSGTMFARYRDVVYPDGAQLTGEAPAWIGAALEVAPSGALRFVAP